ncbi:hypothetical protein [Gloeothece verrucosa]|uniref:Uncharacterized protein n=1 Tax=Gloeothece verrucosa (strain PCC 7822) TaxID=497965 RepID=E0UCN4_GLOV7|nr:hypothetical protein [Gloeothece verrucosa]ADN14571.1 hypothetical protein Cyan7822_2600 [Gloeothece verrucosa PCC 7822]ADN15228.1 hypothetical protein Cyan7822_3278 [Gloeothece verrucosa PCC 7822]ADN16424.1 hypothetical protein Cyan7822_4514 [Gloeothece verrucosa PCC 7822]
MEIRITGTQLEVEVMMAIFAVLAAPQKGLISYTTNGKFYPRRLEPGRFSVYLDNVNVHEPTGR